MDKKTRLVYAALIVIVLYGIYLVLNTSSIDFGIYNSNPTPTPLVGCTMEAKMCPDGSYVSRTGPKCEFVKCPDDIHDGQIIGQTSVFTGLKITPLEIVEDSRCMEGTQCIWAGRVVVKTKFEYANLQQKVQDVEMGKLIDVYGFQVVLDDILPIKKTKEIKSTEYILFYSVQVIEG